MAFETEREEKAETFCLVENRQTKSRTKRQRTEEPVVTDFDEPSHLNIV
jgi:hypothetical protein